MLVSSNRAPGDADFCELVTGATIRLNAEARDNPIYFSRRGGSPLEDDVAKVLTRTAVGTPFEGTIRKVSGRWFPDIVAGRYYGVEVKSTTGDHWTSVGSSILESSRLEDVRRIWMTFGKLGGIVPEFKSRPYEEVLSGIAVTHMPRYQIDMRIDESESIFAKMGIEYDDFRQLKDPVRRVATYYREKVLGPGERLWWVDNPEQESVAAQIRLWSRVPVEEKRRLMAYGLVNFPEVFASRFEGYVLWLASRGVVDPHVRDQYTAGGQHDMRLRDGGLVRLPGIFRRVDAGARLIMRQLRQESPADLDAPPALTFGEAVARWDRWARRVAAEAWSRPAASVRPEITLSVLGRLIDDMRRERP